MRTLAIVVLALVSGCNSSTQTTVGSVVVYTSVDEVFARPIAEQFQKETGITVELVPDTEETKSTGLVHRLIAEKDRPQADVFWSGDPVRAELLKINGVTAAYRSPAAEGLPRRYSDPEEHWTGFSARARIIIFNKNLVPSDQTPKSIRDLVDPRFRGKACLANPLFGTTSMHAAALFQALGDDAGRKFFDDFAANGGKVLSSNGEVKRRVAAGEFAIGLTDTDDFAEAQKEGKPVGAVYPDAEGMGTLIVPNCAVLIARAPHATAGQRFIDYLLHPGTEEALAISAAQMPLRPGVAVPADVTPLDKLRPMKVDYAKLGIQLQDISRGFLKDWVERNSR